MDLVSVIIPYHKKRNTVKETLISVINQSYENLEVLVIYDDTNQNDLEFLQNKFNQSKKIRKEIEDIGQAGSFDPTEKKN